MTNETKGNRIPLQEGHLLILHSAVYNCDIEYTILNTIGQGGSCLVYKAEGPNPLKGGSPNLYIIKEAFPNISYLIRGADGHTVEHVKGYDLSGSLDLISRRRQYENALKFQSNFYEKHSSETLPRLRDHGSANNVQYYIFDYFEGKILTEMIKDSHLDLNMIASIMLSICNFIDHIHHFQDEGHKLGCLYLDCKPDNFYCSIDKDAIEQRVFAFDFDSVIHTDDPKIDRGSSYSHRWAAPEQLENRYEDIGTQTDIYAIGLVFFWMLTQKDPSNELLAQVRDGNFNWQMESRICAKYSDDVIQRVNDVIRELTKENTLEREQSMETTKSYFNTLFSDTITINNPRVITLKSELVENKSSINSLSARIDELKEFQDLSGKRIDESISYIRNTLELLLGQMIPETNVQEEENEDGSPESEFYLACKYYQGKSVDKDLEESLYHCRRAAELGHTEGQLALAYLYLFGEGVEKNNSKAFKWFRKAADNGNSDAMLHVGIAYDEGRGVRIDHNEAAYWFRKAAEKGSAKAWYNLGLCYYNGKGLNQNYESALDCYLRAAENDIPEAITQVGNCYYNGKGITTNYKEAVKYYIKAAECNEKDAINNLGTCYFNGFGVEKDHQRAYGYFSQSAKLGNTVAMNNLAECYFDGDGASQDYKKAFEWYKEAALGGYIDSMYMLAELYRTGLGTERDNNEAVKWYKKAATLDNIPSMYMLYGMASSFPDTGISSNESFEWLNKAANNGLPTAQNDLGLYYYNNKDFIKAAQWFETAANNGNKTAMKNLKELYSEGIGVAEDLKKVSYWEEKAKE